MSEPTEDEIMAEASHWEALPDRIYAQLDGDDLSDLLADIANLNADMDDLVNELPMLSAQLNNAVLDLEETYENKIASFLEAIEGLSDEVDAAKETLEELVSASKDKIITTLETSVDRIRQTLEDRFAEKLQESLENHFKDSDALLKDTKEKTENYFDEFVVETKNRLESVMTFVSESGNKWIDSVSSSKSAYTKLAADIAAIQRQAKMLLELMDDALNTTGVGLNSALSALSEVKAALNDVV